MLRHIRQQKNLPGDADTNLNRARDWYLAAVKFPRLQSVLQHPDAKHFRSSLFASMPKYTHFYDLDQVLADSSVTISWDNEISVRMHLIIALSILHLGRSIDISQLKRSASFLNNGTVELSWKRKLRPRYEKFIAYPCADRRWSIPDLVRQYLTLTADADIQLDNAPVHMCLQAHKHRRLCIQRSTVAGIRQEWLLLHGIPKDFSAHSLRGATVVMYMGPYNVSKAVVRELGGWDSDSNFERYYAKLAAQQPVAMQVPHFHGQLARSTPEVEMHRLLSSAPRNGWLSILAAQVQGSDQPTVCRRLAGKERTTLTDAAQPTERRGVSAAAAGSVPSLRQDTDSSTALTEQSGDGAAASLSVSRPPSPAAPRRNALQPQTARPQGKKRSSTDLGLKQPTAKRVKSPLDRATALANRATAHASSPGFALPARAPATHPATSSSVAHDTPSGKIGAGSKRAGPALDARKRRKLDGNAPDSQ